MRSVQVLLTVIIAASLICSCSDDPAAPDDGASRPIASLVSEWVVLIRSDVGIDTPISFGVSAEGNVLMAHPLSRRIAEYSPRGTLIGEWSFELRGQPFGPDAVLFKNDRYYVRGSTASGGSIAVFDENRLMIYDWPRRPTSSGLGSGGPRLAVDSHGDVYELLFNDERVVRYSSTGELIAEWSTVGPDPGPNSWPGGFVIGSGDVVYVADTLNDRILRFSTTGTFLGAWGVRGPEPGHFRWPSSLAAADDGLYVVDRMNRRIQKLAWDGTYLGEFPSNVPNEYEGIPPYEMCISDNSLFVLHPDIDRPVVRQFIYPRPWNPRG